MATKKKVSFESRLDALETMVRRMESGDVALEEALSLYEEGTALAASLEEELKKAQQRLTVLRSGADGNKVEQPLEDSDADI